MPPERKCDGETVFGFTVKACDQEATHFPCNTPHECYQFCDRHYQHYLHGSQPHEPLAGSEDDGEIVDVREAKPKGE